MSAREKIILVDDKQYEVNLLNESLQRLNENFEIVYFSSPFDAFAYLERTNDLIFLIISDVSMPEQNGLEFKKRINQHKEVRQKSIPFIFFSTASLQQEVNEAYEHQIQGYFKKPMDIEATTQLLQTIIDYWKKCRHPKPGRV